MTALDLLAELNEVGEANMHRRKAGLDRVMVKRDYESELRRDLRESHLLDAMRDIRERLEDQRTARKSTPMDRVIRGIAEAALLSYERFDA